MNILDSTTIRQFLGQLNDSL